MHQHCWCLQRELCYCILCTKQKLFLSAFLLARLLVSSQSSQGNFSPGAILNRGLVPTSPTKQCSINFSGVRSPTVHLFTGKCCVVQEDLFGRYRVNSRVQVRSISELSFDKGVPLIVREWQASSRPPRGVGACNWSLKVAHWDRVVAESAGFCECNRLESVRSGQNFGTSNLGYPTTRFRENAIIVLVN